MSRIGRKPIKILSQVKWSVDGKRLTITGPKGTLELDLPGKIKLNRQNDEILVESGDKSRLGRSLYGLTRALVANMVKGVSYGFRKELELSGVGYRARVEDGSLSLTIGFSHPVQFKAPPGINLAVSENKIIIEGADRQLVGEIASKIRSFRPPEPYKGKGIKYVGEKIRRKTGKAAKVVGGTK